jgi:hypothetical protein
VGAAGVSGTVGAAGVNGTAGTFATAGAVGSAGVIGTAGGGGNAGPGVAGSSGTTGGGGIAGSGTAGAGGNFGNAGTTGLGSMCIANAATLDVSPCRCVTGAYIHNSACQCQAGLTDICPTTGCTDKMVDPDNCGTCGTRCAPTSTCNGGVCGPAPTVLLPPVSGCVGGLSIAASDGTVFYADATHNTINRVGVGALLTNESGASQLALNGKDLYWYDKGTNTIRRLLATSVVATNVFTATTMTASPPATDTVGGFLVTPDGGRVYVSVGTTVVAISTAIAGGGTPSVVAEERRGGIPEALALDGTTNVVYPTSINGDVDAPDLVGTPPAICGVEDVNGNVLQGTCPRLARSQGELLPTFVAVIAGLAYWVDGTNLKSEMIPAAGGAGTTFITIGMAQTSTITAAVSNGSDTIYFADADPGALTQGFIEKTSLAPNSTPILLARGQYAPVSVAVDATKVYWSTADCAILSQAR